MCIRTRLAAGWPTSWAWRAGAPIRHIDHIQRYSDGGLTIYPNGRVECERGNYAREMPGWKVEAVSSGLDNTSHTIKITTPTGHTYLSRAP